MTPRSSDPEVLDPEVLPEVLPGGSLGASGVPLTTSDRTLRDRARQASACKHVSGQLSVI